jgi:hypothetical protein
MLFSSSDLVCDRGTILATDDVVNHPGLSLFFDLSAVDAAKALASPQLEHLRLGHLAQMLRGLFGLIDLVHLCVLRLAMSV